MNSYRYEQGHLYCGKGKLLKKKKVHLSKQPRPVSILKLEKLLNKEKQQKKNFLWCLKGP